MKNIRFRQHISFNVYLFAFIFQFVQMNVFNASSAQLRIFGILSFFEHITKARSTNLTKRPNRVITFSQTNL